MKQLRYWLCLFLVPALTMTALGQQRRDAVVLYKDGFYIKGIINENVREIIYDSKSGRPFPIFSGNFFIHDQVRDVLFSSGQVSKVYQPKDVKTPRSIKRFDVFFQNREIHHTWEFTGYGKWSDKGDRKIDFRTIKGPGEMIQRVGLITPHYLKAITVDYNWNLSYFTEEFGPELTRKILLQIFTERKELKNLTDAEKYLQIAGFLHEAGWFMEAEKELKSIVERYPDEKKTAEEMLAKVRKDRAELFVEEIKQESKVGQHKLALADLAAYERKGYAKIVAPDLQRDAQDLRTRYDKLKTEMDEMRGFLKSMPTQTKYPKVWTKATSFIADELNYDTVNRLDEFLISAQQFDLEAKNKREHSLSAEKVLATAISGWLQESRAALPDEDEALKLVRAREFVLEYLKSDNPLKRTNMLSDFKRGNDLPVDVMARLVRMIPPPAALEAEKINTEIQTMTIEAPEANGGTYLLQLPPDYHPLRAYPVLLLLSSGRDSADETHKRFSEEAAKAGFILATPQWAPARVVGRTRYEPSKKHHDLVTDTIRDLRRRLQIDSDRVFLFGWEDGANMAFDVALSHPDLFAGVVPMNGSLLPFTRRFYWPNAQYLPFYIIGGERDGNSKQIRELVKDWNRNPYAFTYVEYKGRSSEWYGPEISKMLSWMKEKRRYYPVKEMGQPSNGALLSEQFRSSRSFDNRFYWLRGESFGASTQNDHLGKTWPVSYRPATFQANLAVGNKLENGQAKIWNQVNVHTTGVRNVSYWISFDMMNKLKEPFAFHLNGQQVGGMRKILPSVDTLLEELHQTGDRQRLYIAKVDLRP